MRGEYEMEIFRISVGEGNGNGMRSYDLLRNIIEDRKVKTICKTK